jgi:hypothetical protein
MSEASDQLTEAFNPDAEEGTPELTLLRPGHYVARIVDAIVKPYKTGKGRAVFLTWELMDDEYAARKLWSKCTLSHESEKAVKFGRQQFKDICDACGIAGPFKDLTMLYNKPCSIWVRVEEGDGQYPPKNEVGKVKPISTKGSNGAANVAVKDRAPFNDEIGF